MADYRMGLGRNVFVSGPDDGTEQTVTAAVADILPGNTKRVLLGLVCKEPAATDLVAINFDANAQDPVGSAPDSFILIPRARTQGGFPMWAGTPGSAGSWIVWGPGGDFPFCPTGRVSAKTEAGATVKLWVREILDPRVE